MRTRRRRGPVVDPALTEYRVKKFLRSAAFAAVAMALHLWLPADGAARATELGIFSRDIAICGGLLLMVGMGPGPFAIDNRGKGGGKRH